MLLVALTALAMMGTSVASPVNVLLVSTVSSPSHYIWVNALTEELLRKGQHVTELVIRPPVAPHPNRTSFVMDDKTFGEKFGFDLEGTYDYNIFEEIDFLFGFYRVSTNMVFESRAFSDLLKHLRTKKPKFDVFLIDYPMQEALIGFNSEIGRRPVVAMTAYNMPESILRITGSPYFPSLLPFAGVGAHGGEPLTFAERVESVYRWIVWRTYTDWVYRPEVDNMIAKHFSGSATLAELEKDVAVALVNTNPGLHGSMPVVPSVVEVGGMQARPARPLPSDILSWVDKKAAPDGFVYMSFGTNVRSAALNKSKRDAILRAFGRLKQRVLWKYEEDDILDKLPPNVRVAKWLPQNDVLGHPNIRCFVSHNGALGTQEASYHGVPILGVPFMDDQPRYAQKIERIGLGRKVVYRTITEETFLEALTDVIYNPRYRANMKVVQSAVRDQKESPAERAAWYVEMVARTGGAPHLRSPALRMHWYEVWMLDILACAALAVALALWLLKRVLKTFCSYGGTQRTKDKTS